MGNLVTFKMLAVVLAAVTALSASFAVHEKREAQMSQRLLAEMTLTNQILSKQKQQAEDDKRESERRAMEMRRAFEARMRKASIAGQAIIAGSAENFKEVRIP